MLISHENDENSLSVVLSMWGSLSLAPIKLVTFTSSFMYINSKMILIYRTNTPHTKISLFTRPLLGILLHISQ